MEKAVLEHSGKSFNKAISFGVGCKIAERVDHEVFDDLAWSGIEHLLMRDKAAAKLGHPGCGQPSLNVQEAFLVCRSVPADEGRACILQQALDAFARGHQYRSRAAAPLMDEPSALKSLDVTADRRLADA